MPYDGSEYAIVQDDGFLPASAERTLRGPCLSVQSTETITADAAMYVSQNSICLHVTWIYNLACTHFDRKCVLTLYKVKTEYTVISQS